MCYCRLKGKELASIKRRYVMHSTLSRRGFLTTLSSAGVAGLTGTPGVFAQEAPPEVTTIRLAKNQSLCIGPQYVAEDLLRAEGFTTVRYLMTDGGAGQSKMLAQGEIDFTLHFSPLLLIPIDAGEKITIIAGVHVGCFELFATDRPWSQYFCCMLGGNRDFVRKNPAATKRVARAILKATDFCVSNRTGAARRMIDGGFASNYDYALQTLNEVPYNKWREYDPEDTIRFFSLRLREAGMIKSSPNKIIAQGTDWRFFNELKRELKGYATRSRLLFAFAVLASVMLLPLHDAPNPAAPEQTLPKIAPAPEFALISQGGAQLHPTLSA